MIHLIYAVGDVHGRLDLLRQVFGRVKHHARGHPYTIIMLGDYIDRGCESRGVVEYLLQHSRQQNVLCLRGNHDEMLIQCCRTKSHLDFKSWMNVGGELTIESYGGDPAKSSSLDCIPLAHRQWLLQRPAIYEDLAHVFVHAGIVPTIPLVDQNQEDFLWIRDRFVKASADRFIESRHIVHGHTMTWSGKPDPALPEFLAHRTNLDTGAYLTHVLSVGVFEVGLRRGPIDLLSII